MYPICDYPVDNNHTKAEFSEHNHIATKSADICQLYFLKRTRLEKNNKKETLPRDANIDKDCEQGSCWDGRTFDGIKNKGYCIAVCQAG